MKKSRFFSRFNFLSITYLVISFCFLSGFPLLFNWNKFLLMELSYVGISAIFSFFILSFIFNFLRKIKTGQIQKPYHFSVKLNIFHLLALTIWIGRVFLQLYHSIFRMTNDQVITQNFLNDQVLNDLLIAQLSLTIYLLVFIFSIFVFGLIFAKSKKIMIKFSKVETNFFWLFKIGKVVKIQKEWFSFSAHHLLQFLNHFSRSRFWTRQIVDLKVKTIQSAFLKDQKKQTTPPIFFF